MQTLVATRWWQVFGRLVDLVLMGILVAVASLPVVTCLPALAAGATICRRWQSGEDPPVVRMLAGEFLRLIRTVRWATMLTLTGVWVLLGLDLLLMTRFPIPGRAFFTIVIIVATALLTAVTQHVLSLLAHDNVGDVDLGSAARQAVANPRLSVKALAVVMLAAATVVALPIAVLVVAPAALYWQTAIIAQAHQPTGV